MDGTEYLRSLSGAGHIHGILALIDLPELIKEFDKRPKFGDNGGRPLRDLLESLTPAWLVVHRQTGATDTAPP